MSGHQPLPLSPPRATRRQTLGLWILFAVFVAWPFALRLIWGIDLGFGDVHLYHFWAYQGVHEGSWPVLDFDWIYPIGALVPIAALSPLAGSSIYESLFIGLIYLVDAVIMMALRDRFGPRAAAWWLCFLLLLGPIAVSRLDSIAAALATVALLVVATRPRLATTLILAAAWVKVAHATWMLPLLASSRRRIRDVIVPGLLSTVLVVITAFLLGAETRLFSFAQGQSSRGLQNESVSAIPFQLSHMFGQTRLHGNLKLNVWEFNGPAARHLTHVLDLAMPLTVLAVGALTLLAVRRNRMPRPELLLISLLATTLSLLVLNKVGSPQYVVWLSSPAIASFALGSSAHADWRRVRMLILIAAVSTQIYYPIGYDALLDGKVWAGIALVIRNLTLIILFVSVCHTLWVAARRNPQPSRV